MHKITFILGGARSGKSRLALKLLEEKKAKNVAFIATGEALDGEMRRRIGIHRAARPAHWRTFEEPGNVSALVEKISGGFEWLVIDCLTLLVSNLMLRKLDEAKIEDEARKILLRLRQGKASAIIISNEVGLGIVPEKKLGRDFRDIAGRVNQIVAEGADRVFFMVSGIPWRIK